ncbi:unnamed protein product [Caenorhabditis auriculariae]|uniref:Reverse transcriptase domain-containing protein n=1 Tax=Caenorhabditis auriculariae TaxID=2777116 RepID=A0A8S1HM85_9PELO|nr:unnamed protein product [Caenorhabditis auriculariae]
MLYQPSDRRTFDHAPAWAKVPQLVGCWFRVSPLSLLNSCLPVFPCVKQLTSQTGRCRPSPDAFINEETHHVDPWSLNVPGPIPRVEVAILLVPSRRCPFYERPLTVQYGSGLKRRRREPTNSFPPPNRFNNLPLQYAGSLRRRSKMSTTEEYVPPEAEGESQLPHPPKDEQDFENELNFEKKKMQTGESDQERLTGIIEKHRDAFHNEDGSIGCFRGPVEHKIKLQPEATLPRPRKSRFPLGQLAEIDRQKKDHSFRFTVDYRQLNAITVRENYIIPQVGDIIDLACGSRFFTSFDLIQGFFQIPLRKKDRSLTAFATPNGTWQFRRMPMGLCGAPHTFQTAVQLLQEKVTCRLFVYLDDLLLTSPTAEQHLRDLEEVLIAIKDFGLKIRLKKSVNLPVPQWNFLVLSSAEME